MQSISNRFLTDEDPDLYIRVSPDDIEFERKQFKLSHNKENVGLGQLESSAIQRKVAEQLLEFNVFLMHGAAVQTDGNGYLFIGKSGTGKSTHMFKWIMNAPNACAINGDKPFVRIDKIEGRAYVCGSPWAGKERMNANVCAPLKAIAFLERGEDNVIHKVPFSDFFPYLYQQIYKPSDPQKIRKTLDLIQSLDGKVPFYHFWCNNFKEDCFQISYDTLTGS